MKKDDSSQYIYVNCPECNVAVRNTRLQKHLKKAHNQYCPPLSEIDCSFFKDSDYPPIYSCTAPLRSVSIGLVYLVYTGRNAWHGTWSIAYSKNSIQHSLQSAKAYAEQRRTQGTTFHIQELPCLVFHAQSNGLIALEINNLDPLSNYATHKTSFDDYSKNGVNIDLKNVAQLFRMNNDCFTHSNVKLFMLNAPSSPLENLKNNILSTYYSSSVGGCYMLNWSKSKSNVQRKSCLTLKQLFNKSLREMA